MLNHNLVELEWHCAYHQPHQHSFEPPFVIGWCSELLGSKITVNRLTNLSHNVLISPYGKRFMWLIKEKDEPTGSHGVCQGRKFFGCDVFNHFRSWALVPGSLVERAGQALITPGAFKAPEMAWKITAVSSVELNCKVDSAVGVISCQPWKHSLLSAILQGLPV